MQNHVFMDDGLLSISLAGWGQLVKMFITLEPYGIFGSTFAWLFILRKTIKGYLDSVQILTFNANNTN